MESSKIKESIKYKKTKKQVYGAAIWIALLISNTHPTIIFPPNTQAPDLPGDNRSKTRASVTLDRERFSCRYRIPSGTNILIQSKQTGGSRSFQVSPSSGNGVHYQMILSGKDMAVIAFMSQRIGVAYFSLSSGFMINYYKPNPTIDDIRFLMEIKIGVPHVFADGNGARYYLIDYTKWPGQEMVIVNRAFPNDPGYGIMFPYGASLAHKPTPRVIFMSRNNHMIRAAYAGPSGDPLLLEESVALAFQMKRIQVVQGTDHIFSNDTPWVLYLINAMGPYDGSHILKKFVLPWYISDGIEQFIQINQILGGDNRELVQVWTLGGRLLQFTFPETGKEPQFYREVWHKRWKQRFKVTSVSTTFDSYYLPDTNDYFACYGCGAGGQSPCMQSWQCFSTCSTCSGPGETECTSCPSGSTLQDGACIKICSPNQYRKSKTECVDCPSDHTFIKSNLTCLNCWDHNDYSQCDFTRLGYNISLIQDSFLNISFTYSIKFYGQQRSLEKLNDTTINWPVIFGVSNVKDQTLKPECNKPIYKFNEIEKELRITLKECQREAKFVLSSLRSKIIQEKYKVPLMLNLSSHEPLNYKILKADDEIPLYYRFLRFILWILILIFLAYLLLSEIDFINNQPLKLIGNFLKMVDFIQCLGLLEVKYRVLTDKFFWLIELIFSSPEFEVFGGYLNDQQDLRRERNLGKVYEEYGDKMAFNNYDLVISVYLVVILLHYLVGILPWRYKKLINVAAGFREFMYSYAFFEFYINIAIDLSNAKKILQRGNWLALSFLILEALILLSQLESLLSSLLDNNKKEQSSPANQQKRTLKIEDKVKIVKSTSLKQNKKKDKLDEREEENLVIPIKKSKTYMTGTSLEKNNSVALNEKRILNQPELRSKTLLNQQNKNKIQNERRGIFGFPQLKVKKNNKKKKNNSSKRENLIFDKFELISDVRFMVVQTMICSLREPAFLQFQVIFTLQLMMTALSVIKLMFSKSSEGKMVEFGSVIQEVSITVFILLIVLLNNRSDMVQYLMVIALSIAILIELMLILIEVITDVVLVIVNKCKGRKKRKELNFEEEGVKKDEKTKRKNSSQNGKNSEGQKSDSLKQEEDEKGEAVVEVKINPEVELSLKKHKPKKKVSFDKNSKREENPVKKTRASPPSRRLYQQGARLKLKFMELKKRQKNKQKGLLEDNKIEMKKQ